MSHNDEHQNTACKSQLCTVILAFCVSFLQMFSASGNRARPPVQYVSEDIISQRYYITHVCFASHIKSTGQCAILGPLTGISYDTLNNV